MQLCAHGAAELTEALVPRGHRKAQRELGKSQIWHLSVVREKMKHSIKGL